MSAKLLSLTVQIVAAHAEHNETPSEALPGIIQSVYQALSTAGRPVVVPVAPLTPAVPVEKSVFPDYIVCLEDGMNLQSLKRHLSARHQIIPDEYRAKWGLLRDYPMVAPNYTAKRSDLAKSNALGKRPRRRT